MNEDEDTRRLKTINFPICSNNSHSLQFHSKLFNIIIAIRETFLNYKLNFGLYSVKTNCIWF